jgi:hypothetical protein
MLRSLFLTVLILMSYGLSAQKELPLGSKAPGNIMEDYRTLNVPILNHLIKLHFASFLRQNKVCLAEIPVQLNCYIGIVAGNQ